MSPFTFDSEDFIFGSSTSFYALSFGVYTFRHREIGYKNGSNGTAIALSVCVWLFLSLFVASFVRLLLLRIHFAISYYSVVKIGGQHNGICMQLHTLCVFSCARRSGCEKKKPSNGKIKHRIRMDS